MPPLVIPAAIQVIVSGTIVGRPWTNVYGVVMIGDPPLDEADATLIAGLFDDYYTALMPLRATDWVVTNITVTDIREAGGVQFNYPVTTIAGTGSGEPLAPSTAIVITWLTGRRGGSYRGRTYQTGFTSLGVTDGRLGPDEESDETAAANDFLSSFPGGMALGVISKTLGEINPVASVDVNNVFDRQVRRNFKPAPVG